MDNAQILLQYYAQHPEEILTCPLEVADFGTYGKTFLDLKQHVTDYGLFDVVSFGMDYPNGLGAISLSNSHTLTKGISQKLITKLREERLNALIVNAVDQTDLSDLDKLRMPLRVDKPISIKEGVHDFYEYFAETLDRKQRTGTVGLPFDLRVFDEHPSTPGTLIVLGARTSIGKSAVALNMAYNLARNGGKTLYMTAEMDYNSTLSRFYALCTGFPVSDFSNAENENAVSFVFDKIKSVEGDVDLKYCGGWNWDSVKAYIMAQKGYDMIVFDHLHYLPITNRNEVQFLTDVVTDAKMIAGKQRITFLMLAQVNRASGEESEPPKVYHLRGSGGIEQGADMIAMLHRPDRSEGAAEICIAKDRGGKAGDIYHARLCLKSLRLSVS